jgi:hypothetical protein
MLDADANLSLPRVPSVAGFDLLVAHLAGWGRYHNFLSLLALCEHYMHSSTTAIDSASQMGRNTSCTAVIVTY